MSWLTITGNSVMIFHLMEPLEMDPDGWAWKMLIWSLYTSWCSNIWAKMKCDFQWTLVVQFKSYLATTFESWMTCCFIYLLLDTKHKVKVWSINPMQTTYWQLFLMSRACENRDKFSGWTEQAFVDMKCNNAFLREVYHCLEDRDPSPLLGIVV